MVDEEHLREMLLRLQQQKAMQEALAQMMARKALAQQQVAHQWDAPAVKSG